jgi:5-hydroxyisourate hydrolase
MGQLTTHVLDTMNGCPAAGMLVGLYRVDNRVKNGEATLLKQLALNHDGRADGPLLDESNFATGTYRLVFEVAQYFRGRGVVLPEPPFVDAVPIDFGMSNPLQHYHVPLLASPWAYSTYRGS